MLQSPPLHGSARQSLPACKRRELKMQCHSSLMCDSSRLQNQPPHQRRRTGGAARLAQSAAFRQAGASALGSGSRWRVRPMAPDEIAEAAEIQFEGFHQPQSFPPLEALSRMTFRAEVLSALKQKLQYNTPDRFACLVAERSGGNSAALAIADVSIQKDKEVLRKLPEAVEQYAYLSSMAVDRSIRRQGAAQALLTASERMAGTWNQSYLALHLFADNAAALQLYTRSGFEQLDEIKPFLGRARILMAKRVFKR